MDMNMGMMKQFAELNRSMLENFNFADYPAETTFLAHQQPEFLASCTLNNLFSTFNTTGLSSEVPFAHSITSIEDDFHKSKKRRAMEQSTINSQNLSFTSSSTEFAANTSTKKTNNLGKEKKWRSNEKDLDKSEDVIHVRAKKNQATDRHSIAERVRREKINKKMRCLQDLVPGCNKTMGMAVTLEEIINYVHSLQNQVEFLSMELAAASSSYNLETKSIKKAQETNSHEAQEIKEWARNRNGEQNCLHISTRHGPFDCTFGPYSSLL